MPEEEELKQQRATTKSSITRIKTFIEKTPNPSLIELECRLGILESYFKQGLSFQTQIERLQPTDTGRCELEELYVTTKTKIIALMGPGRRSSTFDASFSLPQPQHNRLPHLHLPKFDGKYSEYKNFMNSFENLVNSDLTLTKIEKFNHLLSCLSGPALGTIRAFQVTEENYSKALDKLKERYDNDTLIFLESIAAMFELPQCSKTSSSQLRKLVDNISAIYSSLLSIGKETDICNAIIIYIAMSKVDKETQAKWDEQLDYSKLPTWDECAKMMGKRCQYLEARDSKAFHLDRFDNSASHQRSSNPTKTHRSAMRSQTSLALVQKSCTFCRDNSHFISNCPSFNKLSIPDRFSNTKKLGLCLNCLAKGHNMSKCPSAHRCKTCKQPHHTLLHREKQESASSSGEGTSSTAVNTATNSTISKTPSQVILATALVLVQDSTGNYQIGRALLDSGSQISLMSDKFVRTLNLHRIKRHLEIIGVGSSQTHSSFQTQTIIRSRYNNFELSLEFVVTQSITGHQPDKSLVVADWKLPGNLELADEAFNEASEIDLLLGAEAFFDMLSLGQIKLGPGLPTLQKTRLGWIVSGRCNIPGNTTNSLCCQTTQDDLLQTYVERFWELEETSSRRQKWTDEQIQCEARFLETVEVLPSGRLSVQLPFKKDPGCLGISYDIAFRRFLSLERRLDKQITLKEEYAKFLKEYEELGHMSMVKNPNLQLPHYFIPHQCVLKPNSTSTKLRVVFDASCRTSSQVSLNGILMIGPTIQDDLFIILLRFRLFKFALTADIVKMYRQVLIHQSQRRFQYILWRENNQTPIKTYQLNTVTYGTSSAPFLAIRCLSLLADRYKETYSIGSKVVESDFYVDDMLTGADDLGSLLQIKQQVTTILASAGFELSKWHSNHKMISEALSNKQTKDLKVVDDSLTSTLGITWNSEVDQFQFSYKPNRTFSKFTKRSILSLASSLFDPMGMLSPIIIRAKIILQRLWVEKLDWDESIPQNINTEWEQFLSDLNSLQNLPVPRYVLAENKGEVEIHGFCDASMSAYGCCIYTRTSSADGTLTTNLLVAKSRVAPAKRKQLPRLELCGAHLLARLWAKIKNIFQDSYAQVFFWTDSEIVLHWINTHSSKLSVFVGNRVAEIQEKSAEATWRHVPGEDNPADSVSRGCTVNELQQSIWFSGPKFLQSCPDKWPQSSKRILAQEELCLEMRKTVLLCQKKQSSIYLLEMITKYSSYLKIIRVFAYVLRFCNRIRKQQVRKTETLSANELKTSVNRIVWIIQQTSFAEELKSLRSHRYLTGSIKWLAPFIDNTTGIELIRVGGRLKHANLPTCQKHPLLLPKNSSFVSSLVRHLHLTNYHAGPKMLVCLIRREFWIVNAREIARQVVGRCIHCVRYRPKLLEQIMGNLPLERLRVSRPFSCCGVDFCGPVMTYLKIRGKRPYKAYIAVFVCFSSKAVHLEAVTDLSSEAFIAALKRLIGRRGLPSDIYSDNATNFVGAQTKLLEISKRFFEKSSKDSISNFCTNQGINFHFIPPRAPHFGGLWEAAVKVAKGHLTRTLGNAKLTYEELATSLVEIEGIMNSRPITPLSSDPNDYEALTPAHLLIGTSLKAVPEVPDETPNISYLQRWRRINAVKSHFWRTWSAEYLSELQQRSKWASDQENLHVNAMVLIHEDNLPPQRWLMGRVIQVIKGSDGKVRVAEVRTSRGVFKRPIRKLALLPA